MADPRFTRSERLVVETPALAAPEAPAPSAPPGFDPVHEQPLGLILQEMTRGHCDPEDAIAMREAIVLAATVWNVSRAPAETHVEALGELVWSLRESGLGLEEAADLVHAMYERAAAWPEDDRVIERADVAWDPNVGLAVFVTTA